MALILPFHGITPSIHPSAFIAPTATIIGNVVVEEEASVWFGAVLRGDEPEHEIRVGRGSNVQDNAVIHVSAQGATVLEEEVTIGHAAVMESCRIGRGALVGMNAVVLSRATVGSESLVAAGAVVTEGMEVPARVLVAGAPARVRKELAGEAAAWIAKSAGHYVELSRDYLGQGIGRPDGEVG